MRAFSTVSETFPHGTYDSEKTRIINRKEFRAHSIRLVVILDCETNSIRGLRVKNVFGEAYFPLQSLQVVRINRWLHYVANGVVSAKSGVCKCGHSEVLAKDLLVDIKALETFNYFV